MLPANDDLAITTTCEGPRHSRLLAGLTLMGSSVSNRGKMIRLGLGTRGDSPFRRHNISCTHVMLLPVIFVYGCHTLVLFSFTFCYFCRADPFGFVQISVQISCAMLCALPCKLVVVKFSGLQVWRPSSKSSLPHHDLGATFVIGFLPTPKYCLFVCLPTPLFT